MIVQQRKGKRWLTVGKGSEGERGVALVSVVPDPAASSRYRVRLGSWRGVAGRILGEGKVELRPSDFDLMARLTSPAASSDLVIDGTGSRFFSANYPWPAVLGDRDRVLLRLDDAGSPSLAADGQTWSFEQSWRHSDFDYGNYVQVTGRINYQGPGGPTPAPTDRTQSIGPALAADGRWVVFETISMSPSAFTGLTAVQLDTREVRQLPTTAVGRLSISGDGSLVAFSSASTTLVPGDTNIIEDLFVWRPATGEVTRVATDVGPVDPDIAANGSRLVFATDRPGLAPGDTDDSSDVFVVDLATNVLTQITTGDLTDSRHPSISADGTAIAFIGADGSPGPGDVYRWTPAGLTRITDDAATGPAGAYAADISDDGNHIGFVWGHEEGSADVIVWDRPT